MLHADFDNCSLPAGWTVSLAGSQTPDWLITGAPQNPNTNGATIDGTCMAVIDDEMAAQSEQPLTVQFVSPAFDATANTTVTLSVDVHFKAWGQSKFSIYVFNGVKYILLKRFQGTEDQTGENFSDFTTFTTDLSFHSNAKMRLIFEYDDGGGEARHAGFDNVNVTGTGHGTNVILQTFDFCAKPNGWDTEILRGDRDWRFAQFFNDDTDTTSLNGSCLVSFDDDGFGSELQNAPPSRVMLLTPWVNGTQFARYLLEFDAIFQKKSEGERFEVGIWDGAELRIVRGYPIDLGGPFFEDFEHEKLDLSFFRAPESRVVFLYDDGGGWGKWVGIDNVKITGEDAANDLCETAHEVFLHEKCHPAGNFTAILSGGQPSCIPAHSATGDDQAAINSLWFRYHATQTSLIKIKTGAAFNDAVSVYEGSCNSLGGEICTNRDEFGFSGETMHFDAVAGMDYFIRVSGLRGAFGLELGTLCLELDNVNEPPPVPPNDSCHSAQPLTVGGECVPGNNFNATFSGPRQGMDEKPRADIWYRFEASVADVEILSHANFSEITGLYSGGCEMLSPLASSHFGQKFIATGLTLGEEYFIQISGAFATVEGECCVQVKPWLPPPPPANDLCSQALPVTLGGACVANLSTGASLDGPKPSCIDDPAGSVWFSFVAPLSGMVKFNTGADFPTVVALYGGECSGLAEVKCFKNPLPCNGYRCFHELVPGQSYYLQIAANASFFEDADGGNLCLSLLDGAVETDAPLSLSVSVECLGQGIGKLQVQASGGSGEYVFQGNAAGEILYSGDSYLVVMTDENGCERSVSGIARCGDSGCPLTASIGVSDVSCQGLATGSATVFTQNETGQLTYVWSNGATGSFIAGLPPGEINVTVTDEGGCAVVLGAEAGEPELLKAQPAATGETGFNKIDGTVSANPTGGTPPYLFHWSNGSTSQTQTGLPPGIYTVTVSDAGHCQTIASVAVAVYDCQLSAVISKQNITCHGGSNGIASAIPTGGVPPFSFLWSNGQTTPSVANLPPGLVVVTVTDAAGCPVILNAVLTQPGLPTANVSAAGASASANPSGGTAPFSYFWSNDETTKTIADLEPGIYSVTVTDAAGCTATGATAANGDGCSVAASVVDFKNVSCHGGNDGEATVALVGGTDPLTYSWPGGGEGATKSGLTTGTYAVTVSDASQCRGIAIVTISQPPPLSGIVLNTTATECQDENTGTATVNGSGGVSPYEYLWPGGVAGPAQSGLGKGNYPVLVEDANGCSHVIEVNIGVEDLLPPVVSVQNIVLELNENGKLILAPAHLDNGSYDNCGIANFNLSHSHFTCNDLGEHLVTLTATDVNGNVNSATATVTIVDNTPPVLLCPEAVFSNNCNLPVTFDLPDAQGNCLTGSPVLTHGLPPGEIFPLGETLVTYEVADAAGHTASCSFTVIVENALAASMEILPPACSGEANGSVAVLPLGGTGNFTYQWTDGQTTAAISGLGEGIYHVTVTDATGCSFEAEAYVQGPPQLLVVIENTVAESAAGAADGGISIKISGGMPPYDFEWMSGGQVVSTEEDPANLPGGSYLVQVTDANGCQVSSAVVTVETLTGTGEVNGLERFIEMYPNPTSGVVFVKFHGDEMRTAAFELYDVSGRKVWVKNAVGNEQTLDFTGLAGGVYRLKIISGERVAVKKVVLAR